MGRFNRPLTELHALPQIKFGLDSFGYFRLWVFGGDATLGKSCEF